MQAFISSVFSKIKVFASPLKRLWKLFVDYFFCAILFMLLGEIEQWKWLVTISPSHDTIITSVRPKKLWRNWAIHFLVLHLQMHFQLGWAKSCRCNVILWRSHKPDVLGLWALWGWNCDLNNTPRLSPATAVFKGSSSRISANPSVRVWSVLESSHSLCSNLGNWHFVQAGTR